MNILLVSDEFPPNGGGAGIVAQQLWKNLLELGHNVKIVTCCNDYIVNNNDIIFIDKRKKFWIFTYIYTLYVTAKDWADTIIINDSFATYIAGVALNKKLLNKSKVILHGSEPELLDSWLSWKLKLIGFRFYYHRSLKLCKEIVTVSEFMREKIRRYNSLSIYDKKIKVIYTGIPKINFLPHKKSRGQPVKKILTVSRVERKKGFDRMLNLFSNLLEDKDYNWEWVIVGHGTYFNKFKDRVEKERLCDKIKLIGYVKNENIDCYYQQADVFLLLSEYEEAFGLVYLEAAKHGLPSIGNNLGGVKESIKDGITGYLLEDDKYFVSYIKKCLNGINENDYINHLKKFDNMYFAKNII